MLILARASCAGSAKCPPTGRLILAGSGPGHPSLLTLATLNALVHANLVLADKLIPPPILALIPRRTPLHIARKFPGNADAAQAHLMALALSHVIAGRTVVRLKQGDPYLYGRGGEEVAAFAAHGLAHCVSVLPGLSSALVAPLYAAIPPTQRAVADQVLICTGTAQRGLPPPAPDFVASRTTVFLMALHRIHDLVAQLIAAAWPSDTPCAVIERATCPDQRIIRSRLAHVAAAIDAVGSRPPGLLVVGAACTALPHENDAVHEEFWSVEQGLNPADLALSIPLPWLNSTLPEPPAT
ncbi:hypothetical protein CDD81_1496 [Ophiocordyceps australis]|uniref:uroporphyrinogen-III C-methyltransferase n=1 Tax=Ophiocordyceps australis TaxID=1399860 RepID=A0A2C5XB85_9HYPO|nr:hypothetical protein CDD81_1496 [Ophiocordyceps australis]